MPRNADLKRRARRTAAELDVPYSAALRIVRVEDGDDWAAAEDRAVYLSIRDGLRGLDHDERRLLEVLQLDIVADVRLLSHKLPAMDRVIVNAASVGVSLLGVAELKRGWHPVYTAALDLATIGSTARELVVSCVADGVIYDPLQMARTVAALIDAMRSVVVRAQAFSGLLLRGWLERPADRKGLEAVAWAWRSIDRHLHIAWHCSAVLQRNAQDLIGDTGPDAEPRTVFGAMIDEEDVTEESALDHLSHLERYRVDEAVWLIADDHDVLRQRARRRAECSRS